MRWAMVLLLATVAGGCASSEPKEGPGPDYGAVEEAAEEAQRDLERSTAD